MAIELSLEQENALLKQDIKHLKRDVDDAIGMLTQAHKEAVRTSVYREGFIQGIWSAILSLKTTGKRGLLARLAGIAAAVMLGTGFGLLLERWGLGGNSIVSGWSCIIAILMGWLIYKRAAPKFGTKRLATDEATIFTGLLTASLAMLCISVLGTELATNRPLLQQLAIGAVAIIVATATLLLIFARQQRQLDRLTSTSLFHAIHDDCVGRVKLAIENGAVVNIHNRDGFTPIQVAMGRWCDKAIIRMLIEAGANIHVRDEYNNTPLHYAVLLGDAALVQTLLARQIEVNAVGSFGHTPLHCAVHCAHCKLAIVRQLIEHGADVNAVASFGHTPLHYAWVNLNMDIAGLLLDAGAEDEDYEATWIKEHRYRNGRYDIASVLHDLREGHPSLRRHGVLASDLYAEVSEDERNPKLAA